MAPMTLGVVSRRPLPFFDSWPAGRRPRVAITANDSGFFDRRQILFGLFGTDAEHTLQILICPTVTVSRHSFQIMQFPANRRKPVRPLDTQQIPIWASGLERQQEFALIVGEPR